MFRYWLREGASTVGFLGAAQVDRSANINTSVVGGYPAPKVRLPGAGGAPEIATSANEIFIMLRQGPRAFVDKLDFVTSVGYRHGRRQPRQARRQDKGADLRRERSRHSDAGSRDVRADARPACTRASMSSARRPRPAGRSRSRRSSRRRRRRLRTSSRRCARSTRGPRAPMGATPDARFRLRHAARPCRVRHRRTRPLGRRSRQARQARARALDARAAGAGRGRRASSRRARRRRLSRGPPCMCRSRSRARPATRPNASTPIAMSPWAAARPSV